MSDNQILTLQLWNEALERRREIISKLSAENTDSYRLFSGAAEGRCGLTADRYGSIFLVQNFFDPLLESEIEILRRYAEENNLEFALWPKYDKAYMKSASLTAKKNLASGSLRTFREEGNIFCADICSCGSDPYMYLDFRCGRRWLRSEVKRRSLISPGQTIDVMNFFSYTCTAAAAAASASENVRAVNTDFGSWCLQAGKYNASLNGISEERFICWHEDFFPIARQISGLGVKGRAAGKRKYMHVGEQKLDIIILDPPTSAVSIFGKVDIVNDYQSLLKPCILSLKESGCILAVNHSNEISMDAWEDSVSRCASKAGRPLKDISFIPLDADFPDIDGKHPVKIAVLSI